MTATKKTHVGKVLDAHGIKGDIYALVFSGDASWVAKIKSLNLDNQTFEVKKIKVFKKGFIATLSQITDRNMAEALKGAEVWIDSFLFVSKDGESLFLSELLNFTLDDKILGKIGSVHSFSTNGLQDLLVISGERSSQNSAATLAVTFEIPFVKEFVIKIDYSDKIIYMNLPEGLLTINDQD